jgi:hypothetical protein
MAIKRKTDHDLIVTIYTILVGENGNPGLCQKVDKIADKVEGNTKKIYILWAAIAVLVAGAGGGGYAVVSNLIQKATGG